jgi:hypothetical protein
LAPTFHAESQGVGSDDIVARVLKEVPRPGGGSLL